MFCILIMMCLGVGFFGFILFGTLHSSWICMSISCTKLRKFSVIIFFQIGCKCFYLFLFLPAHIWCECLYAWNHPRGPLHYPHCFGLIFLFAVLIGCLLLSYIPNCWFDSQLHLLYCWFPVNYSLFQLVYLHFWLVIFYATEALTKFIEHSYNHCFQLCIQ